jgi:hypothetical protein
MDWNPFWDSPFWDRVKKVAALGGIVSGLVALPWFVYTVWRDHSAVQSPQPQGDSVVNLWTPTYVIGGTLLLAAILHLLAVLMSRRGLRKLLAMAKEDRKDVSQSVFVAARGADFGPLISENRLDFLFEVYNGSLFPVSISARSKGFVNFRGRRLSEYTVLDAGESDDLQRGKRTVLSFRHEKIAPETCSELQADFDAGKAIQFDFEGVVVNVRITDSNETGRPSRLAIPVGISCTKGRPVGYIVRLGVPVTLTSSTDLKISGN